jgi:hypothetical protein
MPMRSGKHLLIFFTLLRAICKKKTAERHVFFLKLCYFISTQINFSLENYTKHNFIVYLSSALNPKLGACAKTLLKLNVLETMRVSGSSHSVARTWVSVELAMRTL